MSELLPRGCAPWGHSKTSGYTFILVECLSKWLHQCLWEPPLVSHRSISLWYLVLWDLYLCRDSVLQGKKQEVPGAIWTEPPTLFLTCLGTLGMFWWDLEASNRRDLASSCSLAGFQHVGSTTELQNPEGIWRYWAQEVGQAHCRIPGSERETREAWPNWTRDVALRKLLVGSWRQGCV